MVAVISNSGKRLMPTTNYRARKLLVAGKAVPVGFRPFTIRLTYETSSNTQPIELTIDTGYIHVGDSLKTAKHELAAIEIRTLTDEKNKHYDRRTYRRARRNRLRYRKPRFNNRGKQAGWFPPSIIHRKDCNLYILKRMIRVVPVTHVVMEMGQFDTQLLKALEEGKDPPKGTEYQQGGRYNIATLREAVLTRDGYTCQCCGRTVRDGAILMLHHIRYRSQGGSNSMSNLITVCDRCHTPKNHKPKGRLYGWNPKLKAFTGATFMTAVRWAIYNEVKETFPDVDLQITYGARTKCKRKELDIRKSHVNDAYVMGDFHPKHRCRPVTLQKKRRNNRVLEKFYDAKYVDGRTGNVVSGGDLPNGRTKRNHNTDTENLRQYRSQKVSKGRRSVRKTRYPIQPHDIVVYKGKTVETKGCQNLGAYLKLADKVVPTKKVKLKRYAGGYYQVTA